MAAYAALVSLLNNIQHIMNHPRLSTSLDTKHIQPLLEKAGFMLDFIEGYKYGGGSKEAEDLEREIARAAHAAEDVIESHIVDQIHARTSEVNLRCSLDLQQIIQEMDGIMEKAEEVKEKHGLREEQPTHSRPVMEESAESGMVGFDEELIQLMDELIGNQSRRHTISIVGMGGLGKTTLTKNVYESLLIKQHFDVRAWATVAQQYNVKEILSQLLSSLGTAGDSGEQLHKTLSSRRYLIILDDVWSVEVWDKVRRFFPDNGNGSRVVLTTRLSNVAIACGSSCFTMNLLDKDRSWTLFCKKVFQHEDCPPKLEKVGKEIAELCKGLPLSIVVIGGRLLKSPRTVEYWEKVANDIKSTPNSKEKQESLDVLFSSYNHLPPHLKPCFLYTGALKNLYAEIHVSKIIKLWVAEGFLKSNGDQSLEDIAEDYLKDLIDRNLISVGRRRSNGKIKSCGIHDLLIDLCLKVGEQQEFVFANKGRIQGTEQRRILASSMLETGPPLARSILTFEFDAHVLDGHRLLRILDVTNYRSRDDLFGCVNLRYLAFRNLGYYVVDKLVWELPTSVSLAWSLHTLIHKEYMCSTIVVAPIEIWGLKQLRHVECGLIFVPDPCVRDGADECILQNLQTLKRVVNLRLSEEVCKIIPNIKKLHLHYDAEMQGYDDGLIDFLCNLNRLQKLESLDLYTRGKWKVRRSKLNMMLTAIPNSLNKLSLSYCQLHWDNLSTVGSLPLLEVLKLRHYSVTEGEEWSPVDEQFGRLRFLKIEFCDLVCWNAECFHFPVLEKLVLCDVQKLEEIPSGIGEIATLKLVRVDDCSACAAVSAVRIKEDQLETQGNEELQIEVKVKESEVECFREMVGTEGLTLHNIQLETYASM